MTVNKVVCDAGPIIHLHEAGCLDLIKNLGDVHVPLQVKVEVESIVDMRKWPTWFRLEEIPRKQQKEVSILCRLGDIQRGEAHAIILSQSIDTSWLLTDDLTARIFAKSLGIEVHGSLGVILSNCALGHIETKLAEKLLHKLSETSLWLSNKILKEAVNALREL